MVVFKIQNRTEDVEIWPVHCSRKTKANIWFTLLLPSAGLLQCCKLRKKKKKVQNKFDVWSPVSQHSLNTYPEATSVFFSFGLNKTCRPQSCIKIGFQEPATWTRTCLVVNTLSHYNRRWFVITRSVIQNPHCHSVFSALTLTQSSLIIKTAIYLFQITIK